MNPIEIPNFIGGPKCGTAVAPVPAETLLPEIFVGGGSYQRLTVTPNWLVDAPHRVGQVIYLWHATYHDAKTPKEGA